MNRIASKVKKMAPITGATLTLVLLLAVPGARADTIELMDGRIISDCKVINEENLIDFMDELTGVWPDLVNDPEWLVVKTQAGLLAFRNQGQVRNVISDEGVDWDSIVAPVPAITRPGAPAGPAPEEVRDTRSQSEIDASITIQQIRGRVYNLTASERQLFSTAGEIRAGHEVRVTWNSRLRGSMADRIMIGAMPGTRFKINRVWRQVRIGTEYNIDMDLYEGKVWFEVSSRLSNIDRARFTVNGNQLLTTRPILMNVRMSDTGTLETAVLDSRDANIRFVLPGVEQALPLSVGRRVEISEVRAMFGSELDDRVLPPGEAEEWQFWNNWQPASFSTEPATMRPGVSGMAPADYIAALPKDDPGRNPRAIRSVRYRSTFFALRSYRSGLTKYLEDVGAFPAQNDAWIAALKEDPGVASWRGPYVEIDLPTQDVWGRDFIYEAWQDVGGTRRADVRSAGPNGIDEFGFGDDLR